MKSNTKIKKQAKRKRNKELVETILRSTKSKDWKGVAEIPSGPTRRRKEINVGDLDKETKEGETVVFAGKILSMGEISKKITVIALKFSAGAEKKLSSAGCNYSFIKDEINKTKKFRIIK